MPNETQPDRLMRNLLSAQAASARAKEKAERIVSPARERAARKPSGALEGGVPLRTAAQATGFSHMRISQIRDGT
jgi:hypothetical protein